MTNEITILLNKATKYFDIEFIKRPLLSLISLKHLNDNSQSEKGSNDLIFPEEANWLLLKERVNSPDFPKKIDNAFQAIEEKNPQLQDIFSSFDFEANFGSEQPNELALKNLFLAVSEIDFNKNNHHFGDFFDEILYQTAQLQGRKGGISIQPPELTKLMQSFAPKQDSLSVYNPFAGYASLAIGLPDNAIYYGQELDKEVCAIGKMRLMAHGLLGIATLNCEDSLANWDNAISFFNSKKTTNINQQIDFVIGTPPFDLEINNRSNKHKRLFSRRNFLDALIIEQTINSLNENGRAVLICKHNFLFTTGPEKQVRETLIKNDILEYVIPLPSNTFSNTNIPSVLLVISRNKYLKGKIYFFNTESHEHRVKNEESKYLIPTITRELNKKNKSSYIKIADNNDIIKNEYNFYRFLRPNSTPDKKEHLYPLVKAEILMENISKNKNKEPQYGKLIKPKNLKNDPIDFILNSNEIEPVPIPSRTGREIKESCILVTLNSKRLNPTYFKFSQESIFIANEVTAFKINENKVLTPFLIMELYLPYIYKQIDEFRFGYHDSGISKADLFQIKIELPPLNEQISELKGIQKAGITIKKDMLLLEKTTIKQQEETYRDISSIRHSFRQLLNAMASNVKGTYKFVSKNDGKPIGLDTLYSKNLKQTFGEHLQSMEETVGLMDRLIKEVGEKHKKSTPKMINLAKLLIQVQQRFKNPEIFTFEELYIDHASFMDNDGRESKPLTMIDKDDFNILFSNIVSNAIDHGFKEPGKNYKIRTSLSLNPESSVMILEISNNGRPAPENFSQQDLTTRGEKTSDSKGAGTGGADIKTIVNSFNGEFEWINNPTDDFPVTYVIRLPFINEAVTE